MYLLFKVFFSAILIALISEIAKRSTLFGAILASIPLTSLLAMIWIYVETKDSHRIALLSTDIFWLVLPSLIFFVALPYLLKKEINFYLALSIATTITAIAYGLMLLLLHALKLRS